MQNEWVICRVFQKSSGGKKTHISGLMILGSFGNELNPSGLPPLMDSSPGNNTNTTVADSAYVPCFSNPVATDVQRNQQNTIDCFNNNPLISNCPEVFPRIPGSFYSSPLSGPASSNMQQFPSSVLRALIENHGSHMSQSLSFKTEREMISVSQDACLTVTADMNPEISSVVSNLEVPKRPFYDQEAPPTSAAPVDLDCFWNYNY